MNIIIFSKDRPSQLDLLIRSMKKYFNEFYDYQIKILYRYTSDDYGVGYTKLIEYHPDENIIWKKEDDFKKDLISLFNNSLKYSVFFVDDNIFKEPFSILDEKFKHFEKNDDILCLSLRLHPRLKYCYAAKVPMTLPYFHENNIFSWIGQSGDYGYPMSLDGHIFKTINLLYYILYLDYKCPNSLESIMASRPLFLYPNMLCYDKSVIINNPINKVQKYNNNYHGNIEAEFLNKEFLCGKRLDLSLYDGIDNISCHQELPIKFIEL